MNGWYAQGSKERGWNILQGSTRHCVENDRVSIEIDPVCGMEVETTTATNSFEYEGKTYWFCGKGCMLEFRDDPKTYTDPRYQPQGM